MLLRGVELIVLARWRVTEELVLDYLVNSRAVTLFELIRVEHRLEGIFLFDSGCLIMVILVDRNAKTA